MCKRPALLFITIFFASLSLANVNATAHAQIFGDGGGTGGIFGGGGFGGIFEGIRERFQGFFGGQPVAPIGGSFIFPIAPIATPTPAPGGPSLPNAESFVKLSLEWDALSVGPEAVDIAGNPPSENKDPLRDRHIPIILERGCCAIDVPGEYCAVIPGTIRYALTAWCAGPAKVSPEVRDCSPGGSCIPLCSRGKDQYDRCIPEDSPGPNQHTLPFAISNKYIRRDGYLYECYATPCVVNCEITTNYMEFQTEVYHSNDMELYLNVENLSSHEVKNVEIEANNLTYQTNKKDEYPLPHNVDYPTETVSTAWPPIAEFTHGQQLPAGYSKVVEGENFTVVPPIKIGPFNLGASGSGNDKKTFPLQDENQEVRRCVIPSSVEDPDTCQGGVPSPITPTPGLPQPAPPSSQKPCACRGVISHDKFSPPFPAPVNGWRCEDGLMPIDQIADERERWELCRLYYSIGGGKYPVIGDENGKICDEQCWTVDGCPPPWCFSGSRCNNPGPMSQCPGGATIPPLTSKESQEQPLASLLETPVTHGYGCPNPCVDPPRYGVKSCGSLVPRDYENITSNSTAPECVDREFLDVSPYGGCGYNASSNNSVVGPVQFEVKYGETQSSRSILLASLPIGGKIVDDEARPFGWPASGAISQNWGLTGEAQEQGSYRSKPNQLATDYLKCEGQGTTYPLGGRAGDWLHPGIDIEPVYTAQRESRVYTTHSGFITFAGPNTSRQESGTMVQIESDVNRDNIPDYATRYLHLVPGSIQFDVRWRKLMGTGSGTGSAYTESNKPIIFGAGPYVARNQLLGLMGDSGTHGTTKLRYDILYGTFPSAEPSFWSCTSDPYIAACLTDQVYAFFFSWLHFKPSEVDAPAYKNP